MIVKRTRPGSYFCSLLRDHAQGQCLRLGSEMDDRLAIYDQEQNDQVLRDIRNTIYKSFDPKFNISEKTFKLLDRA
uniref:Uncharacterized protein n=1 Tax=Romanomermis culicivorax TaxID=13658 RepID=A0A915I8G7_ROMCU